MVEDLSKLKDSLLHNDFDSEKGCFDEEPIFKNKIGSGKNKSFGRLRKLEVVSKENNITIKTVIQK